jgi:predicted nuclease of predicted toxin-antitoxin system
MAHARDGTAIVVKVLLDMNLSPGWVQVLEQAGIASVHWSQVGDPRAADATLMAWARANRYVVFTHDLDFGTLLAATHAEGPSVLQVRTDNTAPAVIGADVVRVLHLRREAFERGALVTIDKVRARVRILPIGKKSDTEDEPA